MYILYILNHLCSFIYCQGGLVGAYSTSGTFKSVYSILQELDASEKERLYRSITSTLGDLNLLNVVGLAALIATDQVYKQKVIGALMEYFKNEMQTPIGD